MTDAWSLTVHEGVGTLVFDNPATDVNVLTFKNIKALDSLLNEIASRSDLRALLLTSAKNKIFIAGADIREIESIVTQEDAFTKAEQGKAILKKIEKLAFPTICVINGACLGGGYELALACKYRVASFSTHVKIGLPEVNLGILPGFGGSIRLPRLIGLLKSLPLILTGRMVSANEALKMGMVDRLFPESVLLEESVLFAKSLISGRVSRTAKKKDLMTWFLEDTFIGRGIVLSRAKKDVLAKTKGKYPAPLLILDLISKTYGKRDERVFRQESASFSTLAVTDVSKNLIKVFFLSEKYKKQRWTKSTVVSDGVKKCGIIGAGVMGGGIAQLVSFRNIPARVKDISEKALAGALKEAHSLYQKAFRKRKIKKHEFENKMGLISVGLTHDGLQNCGIIIEAVVEDLSIKQKVFKEIAALTGPEVILASNTSSLSVTRMAVDCKDPERIVGLHFFNPVSVMPLVEVIRAERTSEETLERTIQFARRLGKTAILVEDKPGFLVNRILLPYMNEAAYLLSEGLSPVLIDAIVEDFGMPMGPVELVDQVGIDVGYKVAHILEESFGDRMKVAPILQNAKEKGLLGKKSGKGFYVYDGRRRSQNPELKFSSSAMKISNEDALKRMLYVMINEAARCLEEKVIDSAATVDIGMILGTGFPPFRGGLLRYADSVGVSNILKDLERFQKTVDPKRFEPSPMLKELASRNASFWSAGR